MLDNKPKPTRFIKPSKRLNQNLKLDPVLINQNKILGVETSLILDTNILIRMEKAIKNKASFSELKNYSLYQLVNLLNRCMPDAVSISPGWAFDEMPPIKAEQSRICFEKFCTKFLPTFIDAPNSVQKTYCGKENDYGFFDLEPVAQAFLATSFVSLLYLGKLDKTPKLSPIQKFKEFLRIMVDELNILSEKEIEIAKYCFANPSSASRETIDIRKRIRANFLKFNGNLPKTYIEALSVAFNGACDLGIINLANMQDGKKLDGIKQDCWIATTDDKLYEFCNKAFYLNIWGQSGVVFTPEVLSDQENDEYWLEANDVLRELSRDRTRYHFSRKIDVTNLVNKAHKAVEDIKKMHNV